jgi:hypothetical protein
MKPIFENSYSWIIVEEAANLIRTIFTLLALPEPQTMVSLKLRLLPKLAQYVSELEAEISGL